MKKTLMHTEGKLTVAQSKMNITLPFTVAEQFDKLEIAFSYGTKVLEDREIALGFIREAMAVYAPVPYENAYGKAEDYLPIVNLITLSLDCGEEYLGCSHRHANVQTAVVSESYSSYGYVKHQITQAVWNVVLNLHCIVCDTDFTVEVTGVKS